VAERPAADFLAAAVRVTAVPLALARCALRPPAFGLDRFAAAVARRDALVPPAFAEAELRAVVAAPLAVRFFRVGVDLEAADGLAPVLAAAARLLVVARRAEVVLAATFAATAFVAATVPVGFLADERLGPARLLEDGLAVPFAAEVLPAAAFAGFVLEDPPLIFVEVITFFFVGLNRLNVRLAAVWGGSGELPAVRTFAVAVVLFRWLPRWALAPRRPYWPPHASSLAPKTMSCCGLRYRLIMSKHHRGPSCREISSCCSLGGG
jgi:hypothetical protein